MYNAWAMSNLFLVASFNLFQGWLFNPSMLIKQAIEPNNKKTNIEKYVIEN